MNAEELHGQAVVIDGTCPGDHWMPNVATWRAGGATCCVVSVATVDDARRAMTLFGEFFAFLRGRDDLVIATTSDDIRRAKADGHLAVLMQFQGTHPIEYDPNLLEVYHRLGVRVIQLAYNHASPVCDGCEEPRDAGLSALGHTVIDEMNRLGIVVDISHTGRTASHQAIERSRTPVIASHANTHHVHPSPRNLHDDLIDAIAANDGLIGLNGFPAFVSTADHPTLDDLIDHAAHIANRTGTTRHIAVGLDYTIRDPGRALYDQYVRDGIWSAETYPPPPWHRPVGLDDASELPNLTARLLERDFTPDDVVAILGGNWLRVLDAVEGHAGAAAG